MARNSRINGILRRLDSEKRARQEAIQQQQRNLEELKSRYRHRALLRGDQATEVRATLDGFIPPVPVWSPGTSNHGYPVFAFRLYIDDRKPEPAWEPMLFGDPWYEWPPEYVEAPPKWHRTMGINTGDFGLMLPPTATSLARAR